MRSFGCVVVSLLVISNFSSAFISSSKKNNALCRGALPVTARTSNASTSSFPGSSKLFLSDRVLELEERISAAAAAAAEARSSSGRTTRQAPVTTTLPIQGTVGEADAEYRRGLLTTGFSEK